MSELLTGKRIHYATEVKWLCMHGGRLTEVILNNGETITVNTIGDVYEYYTKTSDAANPLGFERYFKNGPTPKDEKSNNESSEDTKEKKQPTEKPKKANSGQDKHQKDKRKEPTVSEQSKGSVEATTRPQAKEKFSDVVVTEYQLIKRRKGTAIFIMDFESMDDLMAHYRPMAVESKHDRTCRFEYHTKRMIVSTASLS